VFGFLSDETFYVTLAGLIGAVLASCGLGHLSASVVTALDASAGGLAAVYTAGKAHQRAKAITAGVTAAGQIVAAVAPPPTSAALAQVLSQAAEALIAPPAASS
jgi:hypothetical protein